MSSQDAIKNTAKGQFTPANNSSIAENSNTPEESSNPLSVVYETILTRHKSGLLPINVILIVSIYNFIVFSTSTGYEMYILIPPLFAGISYFTKYWDDEKSRLKILGILSILFALLWEIIVSVSYVPSDGRGYSLESIPTLILDVLGLSSLIIWFVEEYKSN